MSAFPHFAISSSLCFSHFLISSSSCLFRISLFPHHRAFSHFLIPSALCFSSFSYFLIIVLCLISLFPHHRAFPHFLISSPTCFFLHTMASIPHYHNLSSRSLNIHLLIHSRSFSKSLLKQQNSLSLFMVFEMNNSSDLFQSGNSLFDPKRIRKVEVVNTVCLSHGSVQKC